MSDISFVRTEMLPEQAPPSTSVGALGWARENLFSGWFNSILTVLSVAAVLGFLSFLLPWVFSPTWASASLSECREILHVMGKDGHFAGACWGVIRDRWVQLMFGFYPSEFYWRPLLAFVLLVVALAPILFSGTSKKLLWFSAIFPFIFPWLMWGGNIWGPILVMFGIVLAIVAYKYIAKIAGALGGIIAAVVIALLWWSFAVGSINAGLTSMISSARTDSTYAKMEMRAQTIPPQIAALEAEIDAVKETLSSVSDTKKEILGRFAALNPEETDDHSTAPRTLEHEAIEDEFRGYIAEIAKPRKDLAVLTLALLKKQKALSSANRLMKAMDAKPGRLAEIETLKGAAASARTNLPASVSGLDDIDDVDEGTSKADIQALKDAISIENKINAQTSAVADVDAQVGLVGLKPVISRNFGGFMLSILIGVVAIACSLPIGIVLALGRQSDLLIVKSLCITFIEFIRGVPLITLLFVASTLLNIFLPPGTNFDIILRVLIMVTLFAAAYMAEVVRGGLAALPKGQYEGADSLGLDYWQAQRLIIMPQALKISIPGIVSTFIGVFKDTTLVSIIGLLDPLGLSNAIRADQSWNGIVWELYGFIAVMFFIVCFSMSRYSMFLERKLQTGHS